MTSEGLPNEALRTATCAAAGQRRSVSGQGKMDLVIRRATESDLPGVLRLYGQPGMNDGQVLTLEAAATLFRRMDTYPEYGLFVGTVEVLAQDLPNLPATRSAGQPMKVEIRVK